jgi:hypothetical protein
MNWLSLRNNGLKLTTAGILLIIVRESMEYTSINKEKPKD